MKYEKPPLSVDNHLELLKERGLEIPNVERAKKYLENIGYFRLSGYMYHLQTSDGSHSFFEEVSFDDIIKHYKFDKELRSIMMEYIERIEVALRSRLTNYFSISYGFYWYTVYDVYDDKTIYESIKEEITEKFESPRERFLKSFKNKYISESLPPSNMAMEILTFGKLSRLYKGLSNGNEKRQIAADFGIPSSVLTSWLIYLNNVRNICAHHGRLWNRGLTADRPVIPQREKYKFKGEIPDNFNTTLYGVAAIVDRLLVNINPNNSFIKKLENLIDGYPEINTDYMGFPENWRENAVWK